MGKSTHTHTNLKEQIKAVVINLIHATGVSSKLHLFTTVATYFIPVGPSNSYNNQRYGWDWSTDRTEQLYLNLPKSEWQVNLHPLLLFCPINTSKQKSWSLGATSVLQYPSYGLTPLVSAAILLMLLLFARPDKPQMSLLCNCVNCFNCCLLHERAIL